MVVRADGRGFKKVLEGSKKPYDIDFARAMADAAAGTFGCVYEQDVSHHPLLFRVG